MLYEASAKPHHMFDNYLYTCTTFMYTCTTYQTTTQLNVSHRYTCTLYKPLIPLMVGCVAQLAECRSVAGELTLSYARPAADG